MTNLLRIDSDLRQRALVEASLGRFAIAATSRGLCSLSPLAFRSGSGRSSQPAFGAGAPATEESSLPPIEGEPEASEAQHLNAAAAALQAYCAGAPSPYAGSLDLAGSDFQLRVWRRLLAIPFGGQVTYGALARDLGVPGDARAVGTAVAANPIAILVPCHRVVGAGGTLRGYAWGVDFKRRLLAHELRIG